MNASRDGVNNRVHIHEPASGVHLGQQRLAREREAGYWRGHIITEYLDKSAQERPGDLALVSYRVESDTETSLTFAQLNDSVMRVAGGLKRLGKESRLRQRVKAVSPR